MGRLNSPKNQRKVESIKKIKQCSSHYSNTAQLEDELDDVKCRLKVHANSPSRHKERTRLNSLKKKYEEELDKVQKRHIS